MEPKKCPDCHGTRPCKCDKQGEGLALLALSGAIAALLALAAHLTINR